MALQLLQAALELERRSNERSPTPYEQDCYTVPCVDHNPTYDVHWMSAAVQQYQNGYFDDDSSEECPSSQFAEKQVKPSQEIGAHNSVEKQRRAFLSNCYSRLKELVPVISSSKASNAIVLKRAAEHIKELQDKDDALLKEITAQKKLQERYLSQINAVSTSLKRKKSQTQIQPERASKCARVPTAQNHHVLDDCDQVFTDMLMSGEPSDKIRSHRRVSEDTILGLMMLAAYDRESMGYKSSGLFNHSGITLN